MRRTAKLDAAHAMRDLDMSIEGAAWHGGEGVDTSCTCTKRIRPKT